jgi:hypothetical protein
LNTFRLAEETFLDQIKDGDTITHEERISLELHVPI